MLIAGLDEAGRGPVFGPLVMCGVLLDEKAIEELKIAGVKDSKLLSPKRREFLSEIILKKSKKCEVIEISAEEIDKTREKINLNEVEALNFAKIIDLLKPDKAYVDATDPKPQKSKDRILRYLKSKPELVVENYADKKYTVVAAASILAKVRRDARIEELRKKHGDFGSGYTSDVRTIKFLREWIRKEKSLPPFARKSWETARRIFEEENR